MNVGDKIPEILGIDQEGREIKASDFRGRKIVLYSYPKANTIIEKIFTPKEIKTKIHAEQILDYIHQ